MLYKWCAVYRVRKDFEARTNEINICPITHGCVNARNSRISKRPSCKIGTCCGNSLCMVIHIRGHVDLRTHFLGHLYTIHSTHRTAYDLCRCIRTVVGFGSFNVNTIINLLDGLQGTISSHPFPVCRGRIGSPVQFLCQRHL